MAAPAISRIEAAVPKSVCGDVTLLELVQTIAQITSDEREVVATVLYMLRSGRVRLSGSFRGERLI